MGGREREFPISNYPPGVTGDEVEIVGVDIWLCEWPNCHTESGENSAYCVQHTCQTFYEAEIQQRPVKEQIEIVSLLDDLVEDEMRRMKE